MLATAYVAETFERKYRDRTIIIENVTPAYLEKEREEVKKVIGERLYDVFCKYASNKS